MGQRVEHININGWDRPWAETHPQAQTALLLWATERAAAFGGELASSEPAERLEDGKLTLVFEIRIR